MFVLIVLAVLALALPGAHAAPLDIVAVGAPAVICVFDPSCTVVGTDTSSTFSLPGMAGLARLQSRTFTGSPGAPGAGRRAYEYRLDLSQVVGIVNIDCVTALTLEFGPVVGTLDYDGNGDADDVYVIVSGGLGTVGPTAASLDGNAVTFDFGTPVCAGAFPGDGDATFFFGLTSARPPRVVVAQVDTLDVTGTDVGARVPQLPVSLVFQILNDTVVALSSGSLVGRTPASREARRSTLLERLATAARAAEAGRTGTAFRILDEVAAKLDGVHRDWVVDDPRTEADEPAQLLALIREAIEALGGPPGGHHRRPHGRPDAGVQRGSGVACAVGRYRIEGGPLVGGRNEDDGPVLSLIGGRLAIGDTCPAVDVVLRTGRSGTLVRARWPRCAGLPQGARLTGVIDDATCTLFEGTFHAPEAGRPREVRARLVLCGEPASTRQEEEQEACNPVDRLAIKFQRWRTEFVPRSWPLGYVPWDGLEKGYSQTVLAPIAFDQFGSLGPAPIVPIVGEGAHSGRVDAVAVDPTNLSHWLAGANGGGVWETFDGGAHWAARTDAQPSLGVSAIAFAPGNPAIVYAGTGTYGSAPSSTGILGAGVLRSLDGGTTWMAPATTALAGLSVASVQVSGASSHTLVIATIDSLTDLFGDYLAPGTPAPGVYRSTTWGASWSSVLPGQATDVVARPGDFSRQYAGLRAGKSPNLKPGGVFRSFDGGLTWSTAPGPWSFGLLDPGEVRFAVSPSHPDTLYVSVRASWSMSGPLLGLWRTDEAWAPTPSWTQIPWVGPFPEGYPVGRPSHAVSVHPTDPDVLYATGVVLWKVVDGAWSDVSGTNTHVDHNALAWAGTRLIGGNDGGVFSREEGSGHLPPGPWTSHNTDLSVVQLYGGAAHPLAPSRMLAGAQDNGTLQRLPDQPPTWRRIAGGDGMGAFPGANLQHWAFWSQNLGLHRTKTNGATQELIVGIGDTTAAWRAPVVRCPADADVVLAGARRVWRAENFFSAPLPFNIVWSPNSPASKTSPVTPKPVITAIAFAPSDGTCATYAFATSTGTLRLTTDAGATWQDLDPLNQVPARFVTGLAFGPVTADVLYVALSGFDESTPGAPGHLFRTIGATGPVPTWTAVGPPVNLPHNTVAVNPLDPATLYVGTDLGAWVSLDAAASWQHVGPASGLPNVPVFQVGFDPCGITLFTFGRGAFRNAIPFACP